ncbi:MAG: O-antigen ligase C-terminal domain-containing protein [Rhodoferax sp.]|nr:O-antigen ligase C-terminal domain-containing protein [Rhodoferax sp.]
MDGLPIVRRWLWASACALACAYLMPNHTPPWVSFHGDAWVATVLTFVGAWVFSKATRPAAAGLLTLLAAVLAGVPLLQYALGLDTLFGVAWTHAIYLAGLFVALRLGEVWERQASGQSADFVLLALLIAALASVALQIHQWLGFEPVGPWTLMVSAGRRWSANMAQPNQLASLLLLGLLGLAWFFQRGRLSARPALTLAAVLLFGVALTESRTAMLNIGLLFIGVLVWRRRLQQPGMLRATIALLLWFALVTTLLPWIYEWTGLGGFNEEAHSLARAQAVSARLGIWSMALEGSLLHPLGGYGWGRVIAANFSVAETHAGELLHFSSSHNLLLDLILWNGYPLGLLVGFAVIFWCWKRMSQVADFGQAILWGCLSVLLVHAMLEFPLHYAIFLLPFGVLAGALQAAQGAAIGRAPAKWVDLLALACIALALALTVRDYLKIETSYLGLRFENAGVPTSISREPPDVLLLDQFVEYLKLARNTPRPGVSEAELVGMERVVNTLPSPRALQRLAQNYALNNQPEKARHWLRVLCKTMHEPNCREMRLQWSHDPLYRDLAWPE